MRTQQNCLAGQSHILEHPGELDTLDPKLKALIPRAVAALFRGYPTSLTQLADAGCSEVPSIVPLLRRLARTNHCELSIHRSGCPPFEVEIYLDCGGDPTALLSGAITELPTDLPSPLASVLKRTGIVRQEFGFALGLLDPAKRRSLSDLFAEYQRYYPDPADQDLPLPDDPSTYFTFYENSGAYVCANAAGETWALSLSGGDYGPLEPLGAWLDKFFSAGPFGPSWTIGN